jgi:hypothetical protein
MFAGLPGFDRTIRPQLGSAQVDDREAETLAEFRFGANCLFDLFVAWQILTRGWKTERMLWRSLEQFGGAATVLANDGQQWDQLALFLSRVLTGGLALFPPRVAAGPVDAQPDRPLFAICCLELYNHIVEDAAPRLCMNVTCNRLFVRQKGRAEHGQHRSEGVKYCSKQCARTQAQRDFRQRKKSINA